jgi:pimeloyl-ACP methyl ester carboxylesterase
MKDSEMTGPDDAEAMVVLLPGLWMPPSVMLPLAFRLKRCGYRSVRFGYASVRASLDENAERLAATVEKLGQRRIHLVGHSLGGVLALHTTAALKLAQVQRIVLAGSPYADSYAARRLGRIRLGRWLLGRTVPDWLARNKPSAPPGTEVGVIAGTAGFGLGTLVAPGLQRPHDGVVSAVETRVKAMTGYTEARVSHSGMLLAPSVARLVCTFLRHGTFDEQKATAQFDAPATRQWRKST